MYFLGDDMACMLSSEPNIKHMPIYTKINYNMICKPALSQDEINYC